MCIRDRYEALKSKMHEFPGTMFIIWTPAIYVKSQISEAEAKRTQHFYKWMIDECDDKGDNIFVWDFYEYETEGGLYMLDKNVDGPGNSHPGKDFSSRVSSLFSKFIIDAIGCLLYTSDAADEE